MTGQQGPTKTEHALKWFKSFWKGRTKPPPPEGREFIEGWKDYTPRAHQVLVLARQEAESFHHHFVGTEHVLLGLIKLGQGCGFNVLEKMGVDLESVRREVEKQIGPGPDEKVAGFIPYTPRVKKVLALADKERAALNHNYLGTEHILLGLLREGDGVAASVLKNLGLDLKVTRQYVLRELDPNYSPDTAMSQKTEPQNSEGQTVDVGKRYDVYCREGDHLVVYRNALFKGVRKLLPQTDYDVFSEYMELEQAGGGAIFVARSSVIKFCEHGTTPGSEAI